MTTITSPVSDTFGLLPVGGYDPAYDLEPDFVDPYLHVLDEEMAEADADVSSEAMLDEYLATEEYLRERDIPQMERDLDAMILRNRSV